MDIDGETEVVIEANGDKGVSDGVISNVVVGSGFEVTELGVNGY